jgi:hypothetical protein
VPVRFTAIDAGPDRDRALAAARTLRAAGIRVEAVSGTTVLIRAEDALRAEALLGPTAE